MSFRRSGLELHWKAVLSVGPAVRNADRTSSRRGSTPQGAPRRGYFYAQGGLFTRVERFAQRRLESRFCMRKSNWTPSIVPNGNDQTVYLVADDFGKHGTAWRETDVETADLETVIRTCSAANTATQFASSPSTRPNAGRWMCQKTSRTSYGGAAICRCATSRFSFRTLPTATRVGIATSSCRSRCA
jgi:hypothetical protein